MKKKLLVFLSLFILMIIPKNVFAEQIYPFRATINSTEFSNIGTTYNARLVINLGAQESSTLDVGIESYDYTTLNQDYSYTKYPYIFVFFKTWNTPEQIGFSKSTACSQSCFERDGTLLKQIGRDAETQHYIYILVLKAKKWITNCGVGSGQCVYHIDDILTIKNNRTSGNAYSFIFYNVLLSDTIDILNNSDIDIDSMISSANTNAQNIINSANNNTQNIINNQNSNTQNIINNQNSNAQQAHQDSQAINNSLNDETGVADNDVSSKTSEWTSKLAGTGPVSNMVLMPITLLNGYISGFNSTCSPYNLGSFYGTDIILPCISISNYLGATLWGVIDILFSGFMIYAIGKKFVKIFNDFTNLRDNQMDELYGGGK